MSPVPCIIEPLGNGDIPSGSLSYVLATAVFFFSSLMLTVPSPQRPEHFYGRVFMGLTKSLCLLKGDSLALLKTNFAKKPKNPV